MPSSSNQGQSAVQSCRGQPPPKLGEGGAWTPLGRLTGARQHNPIGLAAPAAAAHAEEVQSLLAADLGTSASGQQVGEAGVLVAAVLQGQSVEDTALTALISLLYSFIFLFLSAVRCNPSVQHRGGGWARAWWLLRWRSPPADRVGRIARSPASVPPLPSNAIAYCTHAHMRTHTQSHLLSVPHSHLQIADHRLAQLAGQLAGQCGRVRV